MIYRIFENSSWNAWDTRYYNPNDALKWDSIDISIMPEFLQVAISITYLQVNIHFQLK